MLVEQLTHEGGAAPCRGEDQDVRSLPAGGGGGCGVRPAALIRRLRVPQASVDSLDHVAEQR